jgi:hypothetical protein
MDAARAESFPSRKVLAIGRAGRVDQAAGRPRPSRGAARAGTTQAHALLLALIGFDTSQPQGGPDEQPAQALQLDARLSKKTWPGTARVQLG